MLILYYTLSPSKVTWANYIQLFKKMQPCRRFGERLLRVKMHL